jgi:hypothetical protein
MAFNAEELAYYGKLAMDYEIKQTPEDLYNSERPFLKMLSAKKKTFPGGKQYIVEKLHVKNDSNAGWTSGEKEVTYNKKRTVDHAKFGWSTFWDGFSLNEDELLANGISMTDDRSSKASDAEVVQFVDLLKENLMSLREGMAERFDYQLCLDGTQDVDAIPGLDAAIPLDPTTGTYGGINRATAGNEYWRSYASLNIASTAGLLTEELEKGLRMVRRRGGYMPTEIQMGGKAYDAFRKDCKSEIERHIMVVGKGGATIDPGTKKLYFNGIPVEWNPTFDDLQANLSVAGPGEWDKRIYMLNDRFLTLRPAEGQDMIARKPPRAYNRFAHYWGRTWRGGLTCKRPSCMGVFTID